MMTAQTKKKNSLKQSGFTIVELLIVIVIIGILAALVIVVYSGIQQRAENAKTISAVQAYKKALLQYATEKGSYPPGAVDGYACLGEDNPAGACWTGGATQKTAFNNALRPYFGGGRLPMPSTSNVNGNNGALFVEHYHPTVTLDGQQYPFYIWYVIAGTGAKCPIGQLLSGGWATFTSTEPAAGYTNALANGSYCWINMPRPTTL